MPPHFEYVLAAYGLWAGVFALYFVHLFRKARRARQALARMSADPRPPR
jgi:hypothetical protein